MNSYATTSSPVGDYIQRSIPRTENPTGVVLHTTSGTDSLSTLSGPLVPGSPVVSASVLITRNGARHNIVPSSRVAFHTGETWLGPDRHAQVDRANVLFLGVELECLDAQAPTWEQYDSAADWIVQTAPQFGWRWPFVIYGHYGLAIPLGRRSDPVRFDWGAFMGFLYARSRAAKVPGLD